MCVSHKFRAMTLSSSILYYFKKELTPFFSIITLPSHQKGLEKWEMGPWKKKRDSTTLFCRVLFIFLFLFFASLGPSIRF